MKDTIQKAWGKGMTYAEYMLLFEQLVDEQRTTGEQTETKIDFTKLNFSRSKRLNKYATLPEELERLLKSSTASQKWLVISEPWCGDAAQSLPFINAVASHSEKIELKIVLRDDNLEVMDQFLTNGSRSIPVLVMMNDVFEVQQVWGPRPQPATKLVSDYKNTHGQIDDVLKKELQLWYNQDKGKTVLSELQRYLES
ncbi:thioredoxin family protein [Flavobacteriaceae bacterium TK19130]|nr:thioredoxin family protein [Thermobacterium salinum]